MTPKPIAAADRLIFALDVPDASTARDLATQLGDAVQFYKLGLELMTSGGYFELVDWLVGRGKKIFADLKFYDVPATVGAAVRGLRDRGIEFATVHGDRAIMQAAADNKADVKILAVTVLTSLDQRDLSQLGYAASVDELVLARAKSALDCGCDGVIASGLEAPRLRSQLDSRLIIVTPGIRPVDDHPPDDQKRVVDVAQAFENGADHIVVGRPIRTAPDPRAAAEAIQSTIAEVFAS